MGIPFWKMTGSGNDFIIIDNRDGRWDRFLKPAFVRAVCARKISVGADGLIVICMSHHHDFAWTFFNADGSTADMCGNGGRCAARYAMLNNISGRTLSFETGAGVIRAAVDGEKVKIQLPPPNSLTRDISIVIDGTAFVLDSIDVGVPHTVCFVDDLEHTAVKEAGAKIRFHPRFQPAGTNVNFVAQGKGNMLHIRTYERGVEDETFACGTGSVAAALLGILKRGLQPTVSVCTRSGEILTVYAETTEFPFGDVFLEGGARVVCTGEISPEAFKEVTR